MLIPVIYPNGKYDMVKDFFLSKLIKQDKILGFKRQDGWVSIGSSQVRRKNSPDEYYFGPERRRKHHDTPSLSA